MGTEQDLDRVDSNGSIRPRSMLTELASVRMLNLIALCAAVLWMVGSVGAVSSLADSRGGHDTWEYVEAAASAGEYLIVTVIAMSAAAILNAIQPPD